jgi:hypothetical protein
VLELSKFMGMGSVFGGQQVHILVLNIFRRTSQAGPFVIDTSDYNLMMEIIGFIETCNTVDRWPPNCYAKGPHRLIRAGSRAALGQITTGVPNRVTFI